MKTISTLLTFWSAFALCACTKQPPENSAVYNPSREPLTATELASLLDVYHWKITQTPDDGKPYWGVRIVVANRGAATVGNDPPYRTLYQTGALRFDTPVDSKENPQILLGLQIASDHISGQINATAPRVTDTTRFQIPRHAYDQGTNSGNAICSGTRWKDNRVDLIEFRGSSGSEITSVVCLEFLHAPPD